MKEEDYNYCGKCDRAKVCYIQGVCFFEMPEIKELPEYLQEQIKKAISIKQALQIFRAHKTLKYVKQKNLY